MKYYAVITDDGEFEINEYDGQPDVFETIEAARKAIHEFYENGVWDIVEIVPVTTYCIKQERVVNEL